MKNLIFGLGRLLSLLLMLSLFSGTLHAEKVKVKQGCSIAASHALAHVDCSPVGVRLDMIRGKGFTVYALKETHYYVPLVIGKAQIRPCRSIKNLYGRILLS